MSQNNTPKPKKERLFFIDVIRFLSMVAIIHFHLLEASFYQDEHALGFHSLWEGAHEYFSRFMAFSGFSIVILSYFLIGYKSLPPKKLGRLLLIALSGAAVLFLVYQEGGRVQLEWDIYSFIAAVSLFLFFIRKSKLLLYFFSLTGLIAIMLPPETWHFPSLRNYPFYNPIFGDYWSLGKGGWPLLPWFGFPVLFFTLGRFLREHQAFHLKLKTLGLTELFIWLLLFVLAIPFWGAFLPVPVGPGFAKFVNNLSRPELFSHLLIVFFCMRLGFVTRINRFAQDKKYLSWLSRLYVNKKFFLFYIVQWLLIGFFSQWSDLFLQQPVIYDLVLFGLFPLTELACHFLVVFPKIVKNSSLVSRLATSNRT